MDRDQLGEDDARDRPSLDSRMKAPAEAAISLTEAAYDLRVEEKAWFPRVMEAAASMIDHGLGVAGLVGTRPMTPGPVDVEELHVASGPDDFPLRLMRAMGELPSEGVHQQSHSGIGVLSELAEPFVDAWARHIDYAKDAIGITAIDPNGRGVHVIAPARKRLKLTRAERNRWQMLAAHLSSGLRLRGSLNSAPEDGLPCGAEAILDANSFKVTSARNDAQKRSSLEALQQTAVRIDRARGKLRHEDPNEALKLWWALLRGQWSMVEWFDTDDRRYMLAVPNPPSIIDPRGLTTRESQVVAYAALGEPHKLISYRLGISTSRTSAALKSAMRKLDVQTQAQLVAKLHALIAERSAEGSPPEELPAA